MSINDIIVLDDNLKLCLNNYGNLDINNLDNY
jgi:hypothetical protein